MSVKTAIMKAFGFNPSDDDDDDESGEYISAAPVPRRKSSSQNADAYPSALPPARHTGSAKETTSIQQLTAEPEPMPEPKFPLEIFDGLLQIFNAAQPDFISKCVDVEAQRKYLYDSMDASFKEYVGQLQLQATQYAEKKCSHLLRTHTAELQELREKLASTEKHLEEQKQQNMSATRQKRAFTERVRDLEQQIEAANAEKEQYALETKSLLNKLKVAQVRESEAGNDKELAAEIKQYRLAAEEANRQVSQLNAQAVANQAESDRLKAENHKLTESVDSEKDTNKLLNEQIESLRLQLEETNLKLEEALRQQRVVIEVQKPEQTTPDEPFGELPETKQEAENEAEAEDHKQEQTQAKVPKQRRRKKPKHTISAIDDSLDTTEWLLPTPPEGATKTNLVSDAEFGYHEPPRDEPPRNDAQLSLFD
ncbi:MAG: hypothetical protein NC343_07520 [Muribaculum sp.]|nr:hypothetical protein [Muribaculaceae bacterium]MCM1081583.1 hypothetical protein [Muribaculum sp.]